jgi:hypothetical protein
VPKRRNKKTAPQPVLALRASLTSRRGRDAEKLGLCPQTVPASFSAPVCEARQDKWGRENPIGTQPSTGEAAEKGFALFEAKPSLQSPGSIEEHRVSRLRRDKGHRGPFFGSFLWASKEMNIMIPMLPLAAFPNFNYVAQARIHHRRKAANDDNLITLASR